MTKSYLRKVTEIVREMTIQPKSEPLEFSVALEKLLKKQLKPLAQI